MENNKKRLLKDLPFGNLEKGTVIYRGSRGFGGEFSITGGQTYYEGGGSSDRGLQGFNDKEEDILRQIWEDEKWFVNAELKSIRIIPRNDSITLIFDSLDIEDSQYLAMGIIHLLPKLEDGNWTWNKFKNIGTELRNN